MARPLGPHLRMKRVCAPGIAPERRDPFDSARESTIRSGP